MFLQKTNMDDKSAKYQPEPRKFAKIVSSRAPKKTFQKIDKVLKNELFFTLV